MKRFVWLPICVMALLANAALAEAQGANDPGGRRVEVGVKGGVAISTLAVTGLPGFDPQAGAGAFGGGWTSVGSDRARLQVELTFGVRQFGASLTEGDLTVSTRVVDVPVLVVGRWQPGSRTRPFVLGGMALGFLSNITQTVGSTETDIDDAIKSVDAGIVFGGGVEVTAGRGAVVLDARFTIGLRDVSESDATTFKSRVLAISAGYRF